MKTVKFFFLLAVVPLLAIEIRVINETTGKLAVADTLELFRMDSAMEPLETHKNVSSISYKAKEEGNLLAVAHYRGISYSRFFSATESSVVLPVFERHDSFPEAGISVRTLVQFEVLPEKKLGVMEYLFFSNSTNKTFADDGKGIMAHVPPKAESFQAAVTLDSAGEAQWLTLQSEKQGDGSYLLPYPVKPGERIYQISYVVPYSNGFVYASMKPYPQSGDILITARSAGMELRDGQGHLLPGEHDKEIGRVVYTLSLSEANLFVSGGKPGAAKSTEASKPHRAIPFYAAVLVMLGTAGAIVGFAFYSKNSLR